MPISNPPKNVPWFSENEPDGDPLLPENRGVEVKPLLRLFDPYQSYDALIFTTVNFQLPLKKAVINSEVGKLINPFSLAGKDQYGLLASGYYALLIDRFTCDNVPFADRYIDRLKDICDYLLTLPAKWKFIVKQINDSTIPEKIRIEKGQAEETDIATVTYFYSDHNCLSKKTIIVNSNNNTPFNWTLELDKEPYIAVYSVVVNSRTGYLEGLINEVIQEQVPCLLYSNINDFIDFFKSNFNSSVAINKEGIDDPFNLDIFIKEYVKTFHYKFQEVITKEYKQIEQKMPLYKNDEWRGLPYVTRKITDEFLGGKLAINNTKNDFMFAVDNLKSKLLSIGADSSQLSFPDKAEVKAIPGRIIWTNHELITPNPRAAIMIFEANITGMNLGGVAQNRESLGVGRNQPGWTPLDHPGEEKVGDLRRIWGVGIDQYPNKPGEGLNLLQYARRAYISYSVVWKVCNQKTYEQTDHDRSVPFNFDKELLEVINLLQQFGGKEINYNFASIVRANAYKTNLTDNLPLTGYIEKETSKIESIYPVAQASGKIPLVNADDTVLQANVSTGDETVPINILNTINMELERETLVDKTQEAEREKETFLQSQPFRITGSRFDCSEVEEVEKDVRVTITSENKIRQIPTFNKKDIVKSSQSELLLAIDSKQWEWEFILDTISGKEVNELKN